MKKFILITCLLYAVNGFSYTEEICAPEPDQEAWGFNNGCISGTNTAYNQQAFQNSLASIMRNPSISDEYKAGYNEGMHICRAAVLRGDRLDGDLTKESKCKLLNICE